MDGNVAAFSDRFPTISKAAHNLLRWNLKTVYCFENFTPGRGITIRNVTPRQGAFSDFPVASHFMFEDEVPPPLRGLGDEYSSTKTVISLQSIFTIIIN